MTLLLLIAAFVTPLAEPAPVEVDCIEINVVYTVPDGPEKWRAVLVWQQTGADEHMLLAWNYLDDVQIWREDKRWRASWRQWNNGVEERFEVISDELIGVASVYDRARHDPTFALYPPCCWAFPCSCRLMSVEDAAELRRRVKETQ